MFKITFEVAISDYPLDRTKEKEKVKGIYKTGIAYAELDFVPFKKMEFGILTVAYVAWKGNNEFYVWCKPIECLNIQLHYEGKQNNISGRVYENIETLEKEIQSKSPPELQWTFTQS